LTDERDLRSKAEVLRVLRRAGVSEDTIEALESELDDPVDVKRDEGLFSLYGLTRDRLVDLMGGSP
jgi:hypothetical protein